MILNTLGHSPSRSYNQMLTLKQSKARNKMEKKRDPSKVQLLENLIKFFTPVNTVKTKKAL